MTEFYSNGKILLTGEYLVLDGGLSLALPTKFGQSLSIKQIGEPIIYWKSVDHDSRVWFETQFRINEIASANDCEPRDLESRLKSILGEARKLNPTFLSDSDGFEVTTQLTFPREWGLGTSSTLISSIARWAMVDPYQLLKCTFGGSGYDIACATSDGPILYQLINGGAKVRHVPFDPPFNKHLFFVYLNKKQDSRKGIIRYKIKRKNVTDQLETLNNLTYSLLNSKTLVEFSSLIDIHENMISTLLGIKSVKEKKFDDFGGSIKSLGAWGGDFVLVASKDNPTDYFREKGFNTILPFEEMVLYG